ncbi:carboxymuconolactone decarboxylase family protein [Catenovulum sp. 2E275]|uniref:carboxymuconolactone decarboxylase family protein n=1 Tax=Catenovulum sp. 2E275 TaxID=2980497 RepID=UPI0021CEFF68|nr:carboxymuconolactone decarboxylase family protein [Catenovulum sp. 2E275]MCU4674006.1 carboxymuconolactone decarboxylase family protein [Catenovulum sp. 2E275]
MPVKLNYLQANSEAVKLLMQIEIHLKNQVKQANLDITLIELIKMRASQINQCAYCLDMHSKDSRAQGETEQRLYTLSAWRQTEFFTPQEQAVLAWTEALTQLEHGPQVDQLRAQMQLYFSDKQIVDITLAICTINSWNRFVAAFGAEVGSYQVGQYN